MKSFEQWKSEELELTFGVQRIKSMPSLTAWLSAKTTPNAFEKQTIGFLQTWLNEQTEYWNEDEIKFFFIGPFITLADFFGTTFMPFTQRPLSASVKDVSGNEVTLQGRVEFMVATGRQDPREPFFFFHEYKPEKRRERDPLGQVLSAMIAAQQVNNKDFPLYGCYVVGRFWFFLVLENNQFAVSKAYDATQNDIYDIFSALRQTKAYIEQRVKALVKNKTGLAPSSKI